MTQEELNVWIAGILQTHGYRVRFVRRGKLKSEAALGIPTNKKARPFHVVPSKHIAWGEPVVQYFDRVIANAWVPVHSLAAAFHLSSRETLQKRLDLQTERDAAKLGKEICEAQKKALL